MKIWYVVLTMFCSFLGSCALAQSPLQNGAPELLINHTWTILHSKRYNSSEDCDTLECLRSGDLINVASTSSTDSETAVTLIIASMQDSSIYYLPSEVLEYRSSPNDPGVFEYVELKFEDIAGNPDDPPTRRMCIELVRLDSMKFNDDAAACEQKLEKRSSAHLTQVEKSDVCQLESVIHWEITTWPVECGSGEIADKESVELFGPPEPGQGTASGTQ